MLLWQTWVFMTQSQIHIKMNIKLDFVVGWDEEFELLHCPYSALDIDSVTKANIANWLKQYTNHNICIKWN